MCSLKKQERFDTLIGNVPSYLAVAGPKATLTDAASRALSVTETGNTLNANIVLYRAIVGETVILDATARVLSSETTAPIFLKNCARLLLEFGAENVHVAVSDTSTPLLGRQAESDTLFEHACHMLRIPASQYLVARVLSKFSRYIIKDEANRLKIFALLRKHGDLLSPLLTNFVSCRLAILPELFFDHAVKNGWTERDSEALAQDHPSMSQMVQESEWLAIRPVLSVPRKAYMPRKAYVPQKMLPVQPLRFPSPPRDSSPQGQCLPLPLGRRIVSILGHQGNDWNPNKSVHFWVETENGERFQADFKRVKKSSPELVKAYVATLAKKPSGWFTFTEL